MLFVQFTTPIVSWTCKEYASDLKGKNTFSLKIDLVVKPARRVIVIWVSNYNKTCNGWDHSVINIKYVANLFSYSSHFRGPVLVVNLARSFPSLSVSCSSCNVGSFVSLSHNSHSSSQVM